MSRFRFAPQIATLVAAAAAVLALSGCGYRPVYGEQSAAVSGDGTRANLSSVKILGIADRRGQLLRNFLMDRMTPRGEPATPRYILTVTSSEGRRITSTRADGTGTRADLVIVARFTLRDATSDLVVFADRSEGVATYNLLTARYASVSSEDEARRRAVELIADQISLQVAMFLNRRHAPGQAEKAK